MQLGIFVLSVVVAVTFTLAMNLSPTPFCHTPELCDVEGSCVWGASYYLVLILVGLVSGPFAEQPRACLEYMILGEGCRVG